MKEKLIPFIEFSLRNRDGSELRKFFSITSDGEGEDNTISLKLPNEAWGNSYVATSEDSIVIGGKFTGNHWVGKYYMMKRFNLSTFIKLAKIVQALEPAIMRVGVLETETKTELIALRRYSRCHWTIVNKLVIQEIKPWDDDKKIRDLISYRLKLAIKDFRSGRLII